MHTYVHIHIHTCVLIYTYVRIAHINICAHSHVHTYVHIHKLYTYVHTSVLVHTCAHTTHIHTYVHIHTHVYSYTHMPTQYTYTNTPFFFKTWLTSPRLWSIPWPFQVYKLLLPRISNTMETSLHPFILSSHKYQLSTDIPPGAENKAVTSPISSPWHSHSIIMLISLYWSSWFICLSSSSGYELTRDLPNEIRLRRLGNSVDFWWPHQ